jgi:hypothetical protein
MFQEPFSYKWSFVQHLGLCNAVQAPLSASLAIVLAIASQSSLLDCQQCVHIIPLMIPCHMLGMQSSQAPYATTCQTEPCRWWLEHVALHSQLRFQLLCTQTSRICRPAGTAKLITVQYAA